MNRKLNCSGAGCRFKESQIERIAENIVTIPSEMDNSLKQTLMKEITPFSETKHIGVKSMELSINPVHSFGERNIYCPHYCICLDHAVINSWDSWECDNCVYKDIKESLKNIQIMNHDDFPFYSVGTP